MTFAPKLNVKKNKLLASKSSMIMKQLTDFSDNGRTVENFLYDEELD